jgi:isoleucyl-tRNA synthetase
VLVKLVKLLAPFTPFVTEAMYQNLVRSVHPEAYESVHHCAWPLADLKVVDEDALEEMALARQISSLGLSARNSAGLKVRQPLARVLAYVGGKHSLNQELVEIVLDELNVKAFEFVKEAGQLVTFQVLPDNKLLGPRFGSQFPQVRAALAKVDPQAVAMDVQAGRPFSVELDGQPVEIAPEEILVRTHPAEGLTVAADRFTTVALDTNITPELRAEGLARELVRRIQAMRKEAGFNIEDRITTYFQGDGYLADVMVEWADYIRNETLSTSLVREEPPGGAYTETHKVDGETITLGVQQNPANLSHG